MSTENKSQLHKRIGRFRISRNLLWRFPEKLREIFDLVVVLEAQMKWEFDSVEYLAISDFFEEVPDGVAAPEYQISTVFDANGLVKANLVK